MSGRTAAVRRICGAALAASVSLLLAAAAHAQASRAARPGSADLVTAIIAGAARTQEAIDNADARSQAFYREKKAAEQRAQKALAAARAAGRENRQLAAELAESRRALAAALDRVAEQDTEFRAYLESFRSGLTALLAGGDPRVEEALRRYSEGDVSALDDLQEVTRVVRKAREAGLRARNAADQRAVATVYISAWDNGEKSAGQVRAAWEEAAEIEPENVEQWVEIAAWYSVEGKLAAALAAIESGLRHASDDLDRAVLRFQQADVFLRLGLQADGRSACEKGRTLYLAFTPATEALTRKKLRLAGAADCLRDYEPYDREAKRPAFDPAKLALARSEYLAGKEDHERIYAYIAQLRLKARVAPGDYDEARADLEEVVRLREALVKLFPKLKNLQDHLADALEELGRFHYAKWDSDLASRALLRARSIRADLLEDDPGNIDFLDDHSRPLTWLVSVAMQQGELDSALVHARQYRQEVEALATRTGHSPRARRMLGWAHHLLGRVAAAQGRMSEAIAEFGRAARTRSELSLVEPGNAQALRELQDSLGELAEARVDPDDPEREKAVLRELQALPEALSGGNAASRRALAKAALAYALSRTGLVYMTDQETLAYLAQAEAELLRSAPETKLDPVEREVLAEIRRQRALLAAPAE